MNLRSDKKMNYLNNQCADHLKSFLPQTCHKPKKCASENGGFMRISADGDLWQILRKSAAFFPEQSLKLLILLWSERGDLNSRPLAPHRLKTADFCGSWRILATDLPQEIIRISSIVDYTFTLSLSARSSKCLYVLNSASQMKQVLRLSDRRCQFPPHAPTLAPLPDLGRSASHP